MNSYTDTCMRNKKVKKNRDQKKTTHDNIEQMTRIENKLSEKIQTLMNKKKELQTSTNASLKGNCQEQCLLHSLYIATALTVCMNSCIRWNMP